MQDDHAIRPSGSFTLPLPAALAMDDRVEPIAEPRRVLRPGGRLIPRAILGVALLILALSGALVAFRAANADQVYPAVFVGDMSLGGLTRDEARAVLEARAQALDQGAITLTYQGKVWTPTLSQIGVRFDVEASLDAAYSVGREADAWDRVVTTGGLLRGDRHVPLAITFDANVLHQWLDQVDGELGLPPHDAYLEIAGTSVTIVPEVDGTIVNREQMTANIRVTVLGLQPSVYELPVLAKIANVRAGDLAAAHQRVQQALAEPVKLTFNGKKWTLDPADLAQFIRQQVDESKRGADAVTVGVDEAALATWLDDLVAGEINRDPVDARVAFDPEAGHLISVDESADGYRLKPKALAELVGQSLLRDHASVEVPVAVQKPEIDSNNLDALGITTKWAVGSSNFDGSDAGRATNIQVGAGLLNGTMIPPQSWFSFNHAIGYITAELGYVEAPVVDGERIGKDIGGGICQVSTTVFRAAFFAGVSIGDWWPHLYRLGFYELDGWTPGLDASILQPNEDPESWGDFTFFNPSDSWMLVESYTDGVNVYVILYGADLGYDVQVSEPYMSEPIVPTAADDLEIVDDTLAPGTIQQTEARQNGLDVSYVRDVYDRDGNLIESNEFTTNFAKRGNVFKVSPDMKGLSSAGQG